MSQRLAPPRQARTIMMSATTAAIGMNSVPGYTTIVGALIVPQSRIGVNETAGNGRAT